MDEKRQKKYYTYVCFFMMNSRSAVAGNPCATAFRQEYGTVGGKQKAVCPILE
jgi:hypothetical protein